MWLIAEYEATTLFSLKPATATASGGKTLLVPTPFAVKMALVDAICRLDGQAAAEAAWPRLRALTVALGLPEAIVVNNTFIKILKPRRSPAPQGTPDRGYFQRTIAYREFAQWDGSLRIAWGEVDEAQAEALARWALHINYLGKRGSFVQLQGPPELYDTLPEGFLVVGEPPEAVPIDALLTQLDDVSARATFAHVNVYDKKGLRLGKERLLHHVALPYRVVASSRGYSYYRLSE